MSCLFKVFSKEKEMYFDNIKVIVSEIDGIVTEHLSGIGEMGITMFKQYYIKDFDAINQIKSN